MTRRKFTSKLKAKVAVEALKEREILVVLAQKYELLPQQITNWKKEFLEGSESFFETKSKGKKTESHEKEDELHKIIGHQKVEIDFLKQAFS